jgi:hypothetical protein
VRVSEVCVLGGFVHLDACCAELGHRLVEVGNLETEGAGGLSQFTRPGDREGRAVGEPEHIGVGAFDPDGLELEHDAQESRHLGSPVGCRSREDQAENSH